MNLDYLSRRQDFREYAEYVESVWGHGTVHQERLRDPRAAAAYLLKAVGYVSKGTQSGQGTIVGNRYGMSQSLRAVSNDAVIVDPSGDAWHSLYRVTSFPENESFRDLGRGLFATPYGVGTKTGSSLTLPDVERFLSMGARWV